MTDETVTTAAAPAEADRKAALKTELVKRGLRPHPKFSEQRMIDMIAEHDAKPADVPAAPAAPPAVDVAALQARLAAAEAALAAKAAEPAPQPYNAPVGMTTTMNMNLPGALAREEAERKMLMDRCAQMGIAHLVPPRANNDAVREMLGRHMAEKAQKMAAEDAVSRLKSRGPVPLFTSMRVLPLGDKKISTGIHMAGFGDEYFARGDIIERLPLETARTHEQNGYGEIIGEPVA